MPLHEHVLPSSIYEIIRLPYGLREAEVSRLTVMR
jgi:hypothetical protein